MNSFERLERQRERLVARIERHTQRGLRFSPGPGVWSRLDVLEHLVKVEEEILEAVDSNRKLARVGGRPRAIKVWMVLAVMRSPIRIKVPAGAETVRPGGALGMVELKDRWVRARDRLRGMLSDLDVKRGPVGRGIGVFEHPVAGWMDMGQMMAFLGAHLRHHEYQLARLDAAWKAGGARLDRPAG